MSVYRVILLIFLFPAIFALFSGKVGRIRLSDIAVILICVWTSISYFVLYGVQPMIERVGIVWVEVWGSYLIARVYIRTPDAFLKMSKLFFWIAIVLIPSTLIELQTGRNVLIEFFDKFGDSYTNQLKEQRLGFERVQGPFSHPIHFGVFFGSLIGLVFYVIGYHASWLGRVLRATLVALIGAGALSSGPLAAITMQAFFILWDRILSSFKSRWKLLLILSVLAYIAVDIYSNRSPFEVFIAYFAMNAATAYGRILVWIWGTKSIWENPLIGIGLSGEWERPWWMNSSSVDMFWIVPGMAHGIPAWILWFVLFFSVFIPVALRKIQSDRVHNYRMGYVCSMLGFFAVGWTVHFWDSVYALLLFLIASGIWILDWRDDQKLPDPLQSDPDEMHRKGLPYSRFTRQASPSSVPRSERGQIGSGGDPRAKTERYSSVSKPLPLRSNQALGENQPTKP
ncbi:hypothetical protein ROTO_35960 [Roseovarius tolerans]|uniref:O-Antigen ligase n=1 Tax=Roseovarius tolerans TaxID=74031 RepID=A0A0L6CQ22_9RHOB|nr:hypothetical protein ROTO_35960 [Roseovarius tolerans]